MIHVAAHPIKIQTDDPGQACVMVFLTMCSAFRKGRIRRALENSNRANLMFKSRIARSSLSWNVSYDSNMTSVG